MSDQPSIVISKLSKRYGNAEVLALDSLSLSVNAGEVYGFLGPNGAGKSTTIHLLMNFLQPSSGSATILGQDVVSESVNIKKSVGFLSSDSPLYGKMTGQQFLDYMQELLPAASKTYVAELIKRLKANTRQNIGELSLGNRQKINIIQALMHQPKVLILDEPTSGLDPLMQGVFYELIREAKQRGACIFTSSHNLSEVQKMCDRVGIIRSGKLISERAIDEMAQEAAQTFDISFAGKIPLANLRKVKGLRVISHDRANVTIHVHGKLAPLFAELSKHDVIKMDARNLDLEEVFLHFYEEGTKS